MTFVDGISIISGAISIVLAIYAIYFAKKESAQSADNYNKTKELLKEIEHKTELIDRSVQLQQTQLINIINAALDKIGQPTIDMQPISLEEIDAMFGLQTVKVDFPNKAGGKTAIIDRLSKIADTIENELSEI